MAYQSQNNGENSGPRSRSIVWAPGYPSQGEYPLIVVNETSREVKLWDAAIRRVQDVCAEGRVHQPQELIDIWNLRQWSTLIHNPVFNSAFILANSPESRDKADDMLMDMLHLMADGLSIVGIDFEMVSSKKPQLPFGVFTERTRRYPMANHCYSREGGMYVALLQVYPVGGIPIIYSLGDTMVVTEGLDATRTERLVFDFHPRLKEIMQLPWVRFIGTGLTADNLALFQTTGVPLYDSIPVKKGEFKTGYIRSQQIFDLQHKEWDVKAYDQKKLEVRTDFFLGSDLKGEDGFHIQYDRYSGTRFGPVWNLNNKEHLNLLRYSAVDAVIVTSLAFSLSLQRLKEGGELTQLQKQLCTISCGDLEDIFQTNIQFERLSHHFTDEEEMRKCLNDAKASMASYTKTAWKWVPEVLIGKWFRWLLHENHDPVKACWMLKLLTVKLIKEKSFPPVLGFHYTPTISPSVIESDTPLTFLESVTVSSIHLDSIRLNVETRSGSDGSLEQEGEACAIGGEVESSKDAMRTSNLTPAMTPSLLSNSSISLGKSKGKGRGRGKKPASTPEQSGGSSR